MGSNTYHCPGIIIKTVVVVDDSPLTMTSTLHLIQLVLNGEWLVGSVTLRKLFELNQRRWWFFSITHQLPVIRRFTFSLDIHFTEDNRLLVRSGNNLVDFLIVHVASLFTLLFLICFENRTLEICLEVFDLCLMIVTTYQELFLFLLCRLVIETTSLDDLVIDVEFVTCTSEHSFFDALLRDEPKNSDDLGLTDTMRTILSLQIGVRIPVRIKAVKVT